jgi:hypothetical protein
VNQVVLEAPAQPVLPTPVPAKGLAIAAMVVGIVSTVFGLVPILALFALMGGLVALVLGLLAARTQKRAGVKRGMARAGWILGLAATGLAIIGFSIVNAAVDEFERDLEDIEAQWDVNG